MSLQAFLTDLYIHAVIRGGFIYTSTQRIEWARCYRKCCMANTNMFIESFHRVLKVVYLHHKQNRHVDFLLVMLMKISRNNTFDWFRKLEIGKQTRRICEIARRHKSALSLSLNCISTVTKEKWKVTSQTIQNKDLKEFWKPVIAEYFAEIVISVLTFIHVLVLMLQYMQLCVSMYIYKMATATKQ